MSKSMINKGSLITDLRSIFNAITPDEMKGVEVFDVCMDVFCEVLEELSQSSIDISNTLDDPFFRSEFYKTYNAVIYDTLNSLKTDTRFFEENEVFKKQTGTAKDIINIDVLNKPEEYITRQELTLFRSLFEKNGLIEGIKFAYDWIGKHSAEQSRQLDIKSDSPFVFNIEGGVARVIYDFFVRVVQHPLGFLYAYSRVVDLDLDEQEGQEYYWNQNNKFQITPDSIDGKGAVVDGFWQNNNNPYLGKLKSSDFPEFVKMFADTKYRFTKLVITIQDYQTGKFKNINLLEQLDSKLNPKGFSNSVIEYEIIKTTDYTDKKYYFEDGSSQLYRESFMYQQNSFTYFGASGFITELGWNEFVEIQANNELYVLDTSAPSVLDVNYINDESSLQSEEVIISAREAGLNQKDFDSPYNDEQYNKFLAYDKIETVHYHELSNHHKPLLFDFISKGVPVDSNTQYSNTINESYAIPNSDEQYCDLNRPSRDPINHDKVFQISDINNKFFFSPLNYEPWQEFDSIASKPLYGYWTKPEHKWKFIGQQSGRPVTVGDGTLIHRGVRKYYSIPGFEKNLADTRAPYYQQAASNLVPSEEYWQPEEGIYYPTIGESPFNIGERIQGAYQLTIGYNYKKNEIGEDVAQYQAYLDSKYTGMIEDFYIAKDAFLGIKMLGNNAALFVTPKEGIIGVDCQSSVSIESNAGNWQLRTTELINPGTGCDVVFMQDESRNQIIANDNSRKYVGGDWDGGDYYWFELPVPRVTHDNTNIHTFYRGLSPVQEEYNYMYFNVKRDTDADPVNLQYRTLEYFEIKEVNYN